jgi:tetratricopeptide (TPR) repeat protein
MNSQNTLALEAKGYVYYEMAVATTLETNKAVELHNEKAPVWDRWPAEKLEREMENGKKKSIDFIDRSIYEYGQLIYYQQFETVGYVKRARAYYIKWSKYDPDLDNLKNALKDYKMAIELAPLSYELFYERAQIYSYLGDEEKYEADIKRVAELKINKIQ